MSVTECQSWLGNCFPLNNGIALSFLASHGCIQQFWKWKKEIRSLTIQLTNSENALIIFVSVFIDAYTNTYIFIACLHVAHEATLNDHWLYGI